FQPANSTFGIYGLYPTILIAAPDARRLGTLSEKATKLMLISFHGISHKVESFRWHEFRRLLGHEINAYFVSNYYLQVRLN
ncbi:5112_t:CDS:2, partial [Dentiscutata heterogama]